ncbi:hypothetical protein ACOMHN_037729 [Nucella lapillus]
MASGVGVLTSLNIGGRGDRESAKQRRRDEYKQDLELQIEEKNAAKQRERLQDMSVNASGYLDPEKRPDRFKPLGGVHWLDQREKKPLDRVRPYHTLFLYDRLPGQPDTPQRTVAAPGTPPVARFRRVNRRTVNRGGGEPKLPGDLSPTIRVVEESASVEPLVLRQRRLLDDNTAGIHYQPSTYAAAGGHPNSAVDQAYSFLGAHDLGMGGSSGGGGGGNSIVQPISMPHGDSRPIIVHAQNAGNGYHAPRFNPFDFKGDNSSKEYQSLLLMTQSEKDRIRRENEDFQRRLRRDLEDERRKISDQENEARKRLEELRRQAEERRREAERERREAERLKNAAKPKPVPDQRPPSNKTMVYDDMNDYRLRLIEERKKIEELLKAGKPVRNEAWDLKVIRKPPLNLPPTPRSADRANRDNINDFNNLKYRDIRPRDEFRTVYPDMPMTNKRLEEQQEALIHQQEESLRDQAYHRRPSVNFVDVSPRRAISRPSWMDREPTPFPHVLRKRDRLYTSTSETDLDGVSRRIKEREMDLDLDSPDVDAELEGLKLRPHRSVSRATLLDDTWLRPSTKAMI